MIYGGDGPHCSEKVFKYFQRNGHALAWTSKFIWENSSEGVTYPVARQPQEMICDPAVKVKCLRVVQVPWGTHFHIV